MRQALILVEGLTERAFVTDVLAPHLWAHGVALTPTIMVTKRVKSGADFKGGLPAYPRVRRELRRLLAARQSVCVTTMFDYYALPSGTPGTADRPSGDALARVEHVETSLAADIDDRRFFPYLSLHEFEALVFAAPDAASWLIDDPTFASALVNIAAGFATPEEIDEGADTAPSRRIRRIAPSWNKALHGPLAAAAIGLPTLRARCPHFGRWVSALEALGR